MSKAYYQDRVKELKRQLEFGDPFLFVGGFAVLNALSEHTKLPTEVLLMKVGYSAEAAVSVERFGMNLLLNFPVLTVFPDGDVGRNGRVSMSHIEKHSVNETDGSVTLNAECFLEDLNRLVVLAFRE